MKPPNKFIDYNEQCTMRYQQQNDSLFNILHFLHYAEKLWMEKEFKQQEKIRKDKVIVFDIEGENNKYNDISFFSFNLELVTFEN